MATPRECVVPGIERQKEVSLALVSDGIPVCLYISFTYSFSFASRDVPGKNLPFSLVLLKLPFEYFL